MGLINILKQPSTFFLAAPLVNLSNFDNFSSEKITGMPGIEPKAAGSGRKYASIWGTKSLFKHPEPWLANIAQR